MQQWYLPVAGAGAEFLHLADVILQHNREMTSPCLWSYATALTQTLESLELLALILVIPGAFASIGQGG